MCHGTGKDIVAYTSPVRLLARPTDDAFCEHVLHAPALASKIAFREMKRRDGWREVKGMLQQTYSECLLLRLVKLVSVLIKIEIGEV